MRFDGTVAIPTLLLALRPDGCRSALMSSPLDTSASSMQAQIKQAWRRCQTLRASLASIFDLVPLRSRAFALDDDLAATTGEREVRGEWTTASNTVATDRGKKSLATRASPSSSILHRPKFKFEEKRCIMKDCHG